MKENERIRKVGLHLRELWSKKWSLLAALFLGTLYVSVTICNCQHLPRPGLQARKLNRLVTAWRYKAYWQRAYQISYA